MDTTGYILIFAFAALVFVACRLEKKKSIEHQEHKNPRDDRFEL
jgi:preprotein translocase subunit YajC